MRFHPLFQLGERPGQAHGAGGAADAEDPRCGLGVELEHDPERDHLAFTCCQRGERRPRQSGAYGMVLPRFVAQALAGDDLTVYGNGTQSRCFIHVLDTVHALVLLIDNDHAAGNAYNVGSQIPIPIIELARRVIELSGSSSKIDLVPYDQAYEDGFEELGRREPDTTRLAELTGWSPARTLDETIEDVIVYKRSDRASRRTVVDQQGVGVA
jgi:nucleoside-diphosphate-sugar epimerase